PSGPCEITAKTRDSNKRGPDGPEDSGLNGPYNSTSKQRFSANSPTIPHDPAGPEAPDFFSEIPNDSPKSGDSHFHPLRGEATPDFSAVPLESSAALTLRSQRTDSGDSEEKSVPGSGSEPS